MPDRDVRENTACIERLKDGCRVKWWDRDGTEPARACAGPSTPWERLGLHPKAMNGNHGAHVHVCMIIHPHHYPGNRCHKRVSANIENKLMVTKVEVGRWRQGEKRHQKLGINRYTPLYIERGFPGGPVVENPPASAGDLGSIPGLGRSPGGGYGSSLLYPCLGYPMDRGAWRAAVHGVAKSGTRLSDWAGPCVK